MCGKYQKFDKKLSKQVKNGTLYGTVNNLSIELAESIQRLMPKAEKMRFATTGSEATMYAVRLARAATGKKIVAKIIGGWHDLILHCLKV